MKIFFKSMMLLALAVASGQAAEPRNAEVKKIDQAIKADSLSDMTVAYGIVDAHESAPSSLRFFFDGNYGAWKLRAAQLTVGRETYVMKNTYYFDANEKLIRCQSVNVVDRKESEPTTIIYGEEKPSAQEILALFKQVNQVAGME